MRRLLFTIAVACGIVAAQGVRYDSRVTTTIGQSGSLQTVIAVPFATTYVCSGTWTTGDAACTSAGVTVYSDYAMTKPITQPLTADAYGNITDASGANGGFYYASGPIYYTSTPPAGSPAGPGSTTVSLPGAGASVFAQNIEQVRYADQFIYAAQSPGGSLTGGTFAVITPGWSAIPSGLMSGALTIVSESSSSAAVTWVGGDKFNANWASGKRVSIDGTARTISSCADSTHCTLSGNAPRTSSYGWMVTGYPTPIYISGGTGTAEAFDITGVGATECPAGTALSVCGIPANSHSGAWTLASATNGQQEAVNALESNASTFGRGLVKIPVNPTISATSPFVGQPCWNNYATVLVSSGQLDIAGDQMGGSNLCNYSASYGVLELNVGHNSIRDLYVSGTSGSQFDIAFMGTTGDGGFGLNRLVKVSVDGATGTATDGTGASIGNAGIYALGQDQLTFDGVDAENNANGTIVNGDAGGGGSGFVTIGSNYASNTDNGLAIGLETGFVTGCSIQGGRIFSNGTNGLYAGCDGAHIGGVYMEANSPAITVPGGTSGVVISGNVLSQKINAGTCMVCAGTADTTGGRVYGMDVHGNDFALQSAASITVTAVIDGWMTGSRIGPNVYDAFFSGTETITNGVTLESVGAENNTIEPFSFGADAGGFLVVTHPINDLALSVTLPNVSYTQNSSTLQAVAATSVAINGGTAISGQTGTGGTVVMSASPTVASPTLTGTTTAATVNATTLEQGGVGVFASPAFTGAPKLPTYIVSGLPSASTSGVGATVVVTDATSFTIGACVGGGTDTVLAVSSGSAWVCQ